MRQPLRQPHPIRTSEIENYEIPPDYLVYKDGADTIAVNGHTGKEDSRNIDSATVFQYIFDMFGGDPLVSSGGSLYVKQGTYDITDMMTIKSAVYFAGSLSGQTIFNLKQDVDKSMFYLAIESNQPASHGSSFPVIRDLFLTSESQSVAPGNIAAIDSEALLIRDLVIENVHVHNFDGIGFDLKILDNSVINHSGAWTCADAGMKINCYQELDSVFLNDCVCAENAGNGLEIGQTRAGKYRINGGIYLNNDYSGIAWGPTGTGSIIGATIYDNDQGVNGVAGILIDKWAGATPIHLLITGCHIYGASQTSGIEIKNNADYIHIVDNYIYSNKTNNILLTTSNPNGRIAHNVGYTTEKVGTATILNGDAAIVVAHGLDATPTVINVTGQHAEVLDIYVDTIGAANFTITTIGGNVTANRDIFWEAKVR